MKKLHLHIGEMLQGNFSPQELNLLLTFQVNCPGCFIYAIPMYNWLYEKYADKLGFLGLSTAFEDFELNTAENTSLLLENGELIGETKKALAEQNIKKFPVNIDFPVAMDAKMTPSDAEMVVKNICLLNPNFRIWADFDRELMKQRVKNYLDNQHEVSLTFTSNQFRGTPTFVLFNAKNEILASWFGHIPAEAIVDKIDTFID